MIVCGISCFYHDSAITFIDENKILFAIAEERLTRKKHDNGFPQLGFLQGLQYLGIDRKDIDYISYYEDPREKLKRIIDFITYRWPRTKNTFFKILPRFYFNHYPIKHIIEKQFIFPRNRILIGQHHLSHAAAAFFTSPFEEALVVTIDGVGERETLVVFEGRKNTLKKLKAVHFPDSVGLFYSVFTHYLGFKPNSGEYKVMGLAPYGEPVYKDLLKKYVFKYENGYPYLNLKYFNFDKEDKHFTSSLEKLLGFPPREPETEIESCHKNLAASVQEVLEEFLFNLFSSLKKETKANNLCIGGGVALNCSFNGKLLRSGLFENIHIHNACGDDAGALGTAILTLLKNKEIKEPLRYFDNYSPYLGREYSDFFIQQTLKLNNIKYRLEENNSRYIAQKLSEGKIVAVFCGRDEWGPRALGNRSILADSRKREMKDILNKKVKFREAFRPFAPICLEDKAHYWFETGGKKFPDMLFTVQSKRPDKLQAVTHVNNTSRVQTLSKDRNLYVYSIIEEFEKITGVPVLINTSFNLRGEPIVASPSDALNTFFKSGIDILVFNEKIIINKEEL